MSLRNWELFKKDVRLWNKLSVMDKLKSVRSIYNSGPSGANCCPMLSALNRAIGDAIEDTAALQAENERLEGEKEHFRKLLLRVTQDAIEVDDANERKDALLRECLYVFELLGDADWHGKWRVLKVIEKLKAELEE